MHFNNVATRSAAIQSVVLATSVIAGFLSTSLILKTTGVAAFGTISLIAGLTSLLTFLDFGTYANVRNVFSDPMSSNSDKIGVHVASMRILYRSSAAVSLISLLLYVSGSWPKLLSLTGPQANAFAAATMVVFFVFSLTVPLSSSAQILLAAGRNDIATAARALAPLTSLGLVTAIYTIRGPSWLYAPALGAGQIAAYLCTTAAVKRFVGPQFSPKPRLMFAQRAPGLKLNDVAIPMLVITIGLPLGLQTDRILLSRLGTSTELSQYSLMLQFYNPAWSLIGAAGMTLWPMFIRLQTDEFAMRRLFKRAIGYSMSSAIILAVGISLLAQLFDSLLSGGALSIPVSVSMSFGILLVVQAIQLPLGMLLTNADGLRFQAWSIVAMGISNVAMTIFLIPIIGAAGPALASSGAILICQIAACSTQVQRRLNAGRC